jgi:hypothetical protein
VLPREDFIFTIGYDGLAAVIDKKAKSKYGKLSTRELAEKGLFRPAYSSAVYSGDAEEIKLVAESYQRVTQACSSGTPDKSATAISDRKPALDRLFGVFPVDVKRSISL